ncbi:MAG: KdsC family phosphatase [Desulfovibrionaceae bacterium]
MKQNSQNNIIGFASYSSLPDDIIKKIQCVRLLLLDIDGVMTDGNLYYDHRGRVTKAFHAQDGLGIKMLMQAGLGVAVITGADSPAVSARLRTLGITEHYKGQKNKIKALSEILESTSYKEEEIAYMGDDWIDIAVMKAVGLSIAVANAQPEVKERALLCTESQGGKGAIREVARCLLTFQDKLHSALRTFL